MDKAEDANSDDVAKEKTDRHDRDAEPAEPPPEGYPYSTRGKKKKGDDRQAADPDPDIYR